MKKSLIIFLGLLSFFVSCQEDEAATQPRKDIVLTKAEENLVKANKNFAFRFFHQVCRSEEKPNLFVSPLSASFALSMVVNGAAEHTQQEILDVLGFASETKDVLNEYNRKLITLLPTLDERAKLGIANSIWVNQDYDILPSFIEVNRTKYNAMVQNLNFSDTGAIGVINHWCNEHTQGMIPQIINEANTSNLVFLLNALHFKGYWKTQFKKNNTHNEVFHNLDYTQTSIPLMHLSDERFRYSSNSYFDIAWLPYGNEAFSLVILLPVKEKKWDECIAQLTAENWQTWLDNSYVQPMDLKLPRFSLYYDKDLIADMQALGMKDAFDKDKADFSQLCRIPLHLSLLKQAAALEVDEEGTTAAAGTVGGGGISSVGPGGMFYVNRPFVFMITEYSTGSILFMGRVTKL